MTVDEAIKIYNDGDAVLSSEAIRIIESPAVRFKDGLAYKYEPTEEELAKLRHQLAGDAMAENAKRDAEAKVQDAKREETEALNRLNIIMGIRADTVKAYFTGCISSGRGFHPHDVVLSDMLTDIIEASTTGPTPHLARTLMSRVNAFDAMTREFFAEPKDNFADHIGNIDSVQTPVMNAVKDEPHVREGRDLFEELLSIVGGDEKRLQGATYPDHWTMKDAKTYETHMRAYEKQKRERAEEANRVYKIEPELDLARGVHDAMQGVGIHDWNADALPSVLDEASVKEMPKVSYEEERPLARVAERHERRAGAADSSGIVILD